MINKGSYMYMYLFLLHKNNIRSIQSCNIKSYGFTPRNYHGRKHILVNWTGNDDSNMHVVSMAMMQQVVRGSWVWGMEGGLRYIVYIVKLPKTGMVHSSSQPSEYRILFLFFGPPMEYYWIRAWFSWTWPRCEMKRDFLCRSCECSRHGFQILRTSGR